MQNGPSVRSGECTERPERLQGRAAPRTRKRAGAPMGTPPSSACLPPPRRGEDFRPFQKMRRMEYPDWNVDTALHG